MSKLGVFCGFLLLVGSAAVSGATSLGITLEQPTPNPSYLTVANTVDLAGSLKNARSKR